MTSPGDDDPWRTIVAAPPAATPREWIGELIETARVPAAIVLGLALLGGPVGLIWSKVSPRVAISFSADGPSLVHPESSEFFDTDAAFLVVLLVTGLLTGIAVWALARGRGVRVPVGIAIGGVVGGGVAQAVGERVVVDSQLAEACRQAVCAIYDGTMRVRIGALHLGHHRIYLTGIVWAVAALVAFFALTLAFDPADDVVPVGVPGPWAPPSPQPAFDWAPPDRGSGVS